MGVADIYKGLNNSPTYGMTHTCLTRLAGCKMAEVSTIDRFVTGRADLCARKEFEPKENIGHQHHPEVTWGVPIRIRCM